METSLAEPFLKTTEAPQTGIDIQARLSVIRRRLLVFLGVLVLSIVAGGIVSVRAARVYRASAMVLIDVNAPEVLSGVREVYNSGLGYWTSKEYYQTQYSVIRSRSVSEKVVATLGLAPASIIGELQRAAPMSAQARIAGEPLFDLPTGLQSKLRMLGVGGLPSREAMIEALGKLDPAAFIQGRIQAEPVKDSRLVQIVIEDTDPKQAAAIANAVANAYIDVNLDQKIDVTRSAVNWLSDQMVDLKTKVEQSELALHAFRKLNNMVSISIEDRQTMISQTLSQLNQSLSTARAQGFEYESRRDQIANALAAGTIPDTFQEVIANPFVQKLKAEYSDLRQEEADLSMRYTEQHPKLKAVREKLALVEGELKGETTKVIDTLTQQYDLSADTQRRLTREIERVKVDALEVGKKEMEYSRLRRDRDNNLALYEVIMKREKEANLTQMLKVNNVRMLDAARPPVKPVRPNIRLNMLAAVLIGLLGGIAVAFAVDYLDNTVKSQDQVERVIGLPFLGIVPTVKMVKSDKKQELYERDLYVVAHPRSTTAECWRTIRTNIMFMTPDNPARTIVVGSSEQREGKSTTVINLAITMAQLGARTLVLDTDMRRPRLHRSFGMVNDTGLSALILGDVTPEVAIRPSGVERLDLLSCGPIPPNPVELLHTEAFRNIFAMLQTRYDRIILDSPPVRAVTDALVLASMVDGVVLVAHAGHSTWQATVQTKRRFEDVGARIFGLVLNSVDLDKRGGEYYYYQNYRYGEDVTG